MSALWAVAVGVPVIGCIGLLAWVRRLRGDHGALAKRHDLAHGRLRNELSAATAVSARAQADADASRHAISSALLENGRLQERLVELKASSVARDDYDAAIEEQRRLRQEIEVLRRELQLLSPVIAELQHNRGFVETLQRELVYRDEQLLAIERRDMAVIDLTDGAGRSAGQLRHAGRVQPPLEELVEGSTGDL